MLKVATNKDNQELHIVLEGRIDSNTALQFEDAVKEYFQDKFISVNLDCEKLDFISSAGLRVLLQMRKAFGEYVPIKAFHVSESVKSVFDLTGFEDVITIASMQEASSKKIKAVFFDVDGTLLSQKTKQVPESTKEALALLRKNGIMTIICTGRMIAELENLPVMELPFDGYLTLNGNLCLDKNKKMFAGNEIAPQEVEVLVRIFKASKIPFVLNGAEKRYINYVDNVVIDTQASTNGTIPDIGEYSGEKIYQCLAFVHDKERLMLDNMLDECSITSWNDTGIDIISKQGGKAHGIEKFLTQYNLRRGETMAFGDGENDMDMIQYVGVGVAMGNAINDLKKAADYVTTDIDDDGIYNALKHFELI